MWRSIHLEADITTCSHIAEIDSSAFSDACKSYPFIWDDGEVSCSGACMGESPSDPLEGYHSTGPWQRTGAVGEGSPAHPDDTLRGSPWLLECCDEEAGREEQSSSTFDLLLVEFHSTACCCTTFLGNVY